MPEEPIKRGPGRPRKNPPPPSLGVPQGSPPPVLTQPDSMTKIKALKVYISPKFNGKPVGGIPRVVEGMIKYLPQFGIEIVDTEDEADLLCCHAYIPSAFIKRFPNKPMVLVSHGMYWSEIPGWGNQEFKSNSDQMESIRVSDAVITCSEWVANSIRRNTSRPVHVIYHGIDAEEWNPTADKAYVLWNKFRSDPVCDPEPVNQVAKLLPNVQFVTMFGEEAPNVKVIGQLDFETSKKLIEGASIYLCTTRETFGIGTLEAMACGIPVVGFDFGGQHEFIENGVDGILVTPGDIPALAEAIENAGRNRKVIGAAARRKAETFNWTSACRRYASIFKSAWTDKWLQTKAPRTSIIVTNYNLEKYLPDCLESVRNQVDQDWECIIVDDHSTNDTGFEIAVSYMRSDGRFKVVRNEKNLYLAEARNVGIRLANGRYILPLDADDMLAPNTVSLLADSLDSDRSIHVAYGGVFFVNEDGKTPTDYGKEYGRHLQPGHSSWPFQFEHEKQIQQMNLLPYCSMYRKEAWEQTGGYRRRCRTAEDADMWVRFSSYGFRPKMVTDGDTLIYRNREGSMSRTNSTEWIRWFSWTKLPEITPAGAVTKIQLPIPSLDPILISVIIPVGPGHEKIVTDAIDSVDCQSFRNWECIVVNDSGKPLETELPSWVRVITTEGAQGPARARNAGIRASKGRAFLPLDADDYLEPDALQFMWDAHQIDHEVIYSDFWQSDMEGKKVSLHQCDDYDPHLITGRKRIFNNQQREGMIHTVTALTPKSAWEKVGGYDETLSAWEDWDFQLALGNIGICSRRIPLPLFFYRKHTGFRREENYEFFERSKAGIINKWGKELWEGSKELMSCGSCAAARKAGIPASGIWAAKAARPITSGEAELVRYEGNKEGSIAYRGPSKTMYYFGKGDTKFVLKEDVSMFMQYKEFVVVQQEAPVMNMSEPVLQALGQA